MSERRKMFDPAPVYGGYWSETEQQPPLWFTVSEQSDEPVATGLLDKQGHPIFRSSDKRKIGFIR